MPGVSRTYIDVFSLCLAIDELTQRVSSAHNVFVKYRYRANHSPLVEKRILFDDLAVKAQRSTTMDDHVRLGRQYQIAVIQHQFNMIDSAILLWGSRNAKIVKYIFLMSNVSAEKRSHTLCISSAHVI